MRLYALFKIRFAVQVLEHEAAYLATLPKAEMYERSYMHRDSVTHVVVAQVGHMQCPVQLYVILEP